MCGGKFKNAALQFDQRGRTQVAPVNLHLVCVAEPCTVKHARQRQHRAFVDCRPWQERQIRWLDDRRGVGDVDGLAGRHPHASVVVADDQRHHVGAPFVRNQFECWIGPGAVEIVVLGNGPIIAVRVGHPRIGHIGHQRYRVALSC